MLSSVDLPLPDGPSSTTSSPGASVEVDALQRRDLELAHAVALGEAVAPDRHVAVAHGAHRSDLNAVQVMTPVRKRVKAET